MKRAVYLAILGDGHPFGESLQPHYQGLGIDSWNLWKDSKDLPTYDGLSPLWGDALPILVYLGPEGEEFEKALAYAERWRMIVFLGNLNIELPNPLNVAVVETIFLCQDIDSGKKIKVLGEAIRRLIQQPFSPGFYGVEDLPLLT